MLGCQRGALPVPGSVSQPPTGTAQGPRPSHEDWWSFHEGAGQPLTVSGWAWVAQRPWRLVPTPRGDEEAAQ